MSSGDSLPQVLINPKLHRRQINDGSFSRTNNYAQENKKHLCPPIDALKDKASAEGVALSALQEKSLAGLQHAVQSDNSSADTAISPLSPANGLSPACTAMANACSHDHDYLSPDLHRRNRDGTRHMSELSLNIDCTENGVILPRHDVTTVVRVPVPPKTVVTQNSPRDGKLMRDVILRHHRRIVKPASDANEVSGKQHQQSPPVSDEPACVFVSFSKTAQPRRMRPRTARRKVKTADENLALNKVQTPSVSSRKSSCTTLSDSSKEISSERSERNVDFDVTKDKLTVEWQNMVRQYHSKPENIVHSSDSLSEDDLGQPVRQSTPEKTELKPKKECIIPSPRPSVTPCPPTASRRSTRYGLEDNSNYRVSENDEVKNMNIEKADSAYFSFNSSISSLQPRSCTGTPTTKPTTRDHSRPSTGQRSAGSTRPPSGGKRIADASLSSTSSGSSSDDDSLHSSTSSRNVEEDTNNREARSTERKSRNSSFDRLKSAADNLQKEHKVVRLRKGKKVIVKPHMRPVPPRKPKDPLPMNRRALPTSFFKEPNRFSPSPYNILPPVLPLFPQPLNDDINAMRPVTPPEQQRPSDDHHQNYPENNKQIVIKMGDTDLLHRLFDSVDPQPQKRGHRIKRGRPKRPPKILPSPKLTLDNNPCIMQSITEKLFPNLSIEKRNIKQKHFHHHVVSGMVLGSDKSVIDDSGGNISSRDSAEFDNFEKDLSQFGLLSFNSLSYEEDVTDSRMEISSPGPLAQRQEVLALPQLPLAQDYSQMLSDVAAVL